jgi:hypothetical protein
LVDGILKEHNAREAVGDGSALWAGGGLFSGGVKFFVERLVAVLGLASLEG